MTEARREAILAAAKAVFEEVGFEQATMSEISTKVGGSKATLYRYFESKEALFQELVRRSASEYTGSVFALLHPGWQPNGQELPPEVAETLALLQPGEDVAATLRNVGERVLKTFHTPQKFAVRRMMIAAANDSNAGKLFYENGPARGMQHLAHYFDAVMNAGYLRRADAKVAAAQFRALLEAEVEEMGLLNIRTTLTDEEIHAYADRAVDVFMRAYGPT